MILIRCRWCHHSFSVSLWFFVWKCWAQKKNGLQLHPPRAQLLNRKNHQVQGNFQATRRMNARHSTSASTRRSGPEGSCSTHFGGHNKSQEIHGKSLATTIENDENGGFAVNLSPSSNSVVFNAEKGEHAYTSPLSEFCLSLLICFCASLLFPAWFTFTTHKSQGTSYINPEPDLNQPYINPKPNQHPTNKATLSKP